MISHTLSSQREESDLVSLLGLYSPRNCTQPPYGLKTLNKSLDRHSQRGASSVVPSLSLWELMVGEIILISLCYYCTAFQSIEFIDWVEMCSHFKALLSVLSQRQRVYFDLVSLLGPGIASTHHMGFALPSLNISVIYYCLNGWCEKLDLHG